MLQYIQASPELIAHRAAGKCSDEEFIRTQLLNAYIAEHGGNVSNKRLSEIWFTKYKTASGILSKMIGAKLFEANGYGPDRVLKPLFPYNKTK